MGLVFLAALPLRGALWQGDAWALNGTFRGATGYDSNLTLSDDGPADFYLLGNPRLTFFRRNSLTDLHIVGGVTSTTYLDKQQEAHNAFMVEAAYAYPFEPGVTPVYRAEIGWSRATEPNAYLGRRVGRDRAFLTAEGYLPLTGKLGVRGQAEFTRTEHREAALNNNQRAGAFVGLAYQLLPRVQTSVNVGYLEGESDPRRAGLLPVKSRELYTTLRARAEFSAKLSGSVYAGFGQVSYRGSYRNRYELPIGGADLTWGIDTRRTVVLSANAGVDYAPDGQSVNERRVGLSYTHVLMSRWEFSVQGGVGEAVFRRELRQRSDEFWTGGGGLAYQPSERFRAALQARFTTQNSTTAYNNYDRTFVGLESSYRF